MYIGTLHSKIQYSLSKYSRYNNYSREFSSRTLLSKTYKFLKARTYLIQETFITNHKDLKIDNN